MRQVPYVPQTARDRQCEAADTTAVIVALRPLVPILNSFNYRHRNQHSTSCWWTSFAVLRRALQRLIRQPAHNLAARARWLRSHVMPTAYLAFSQLAADNQHAPLGLMLLAVLAHTHCVLSPYDASSEVHLESALNMPATPHQRLQSLTASPDVDRGVTVSRQDFITTSSDRPSDSTPLTTPCTKHVKTRGSVATIAVKTLKKRKISGKGDALANIFNSLT